MPKTFSAGIVTLALVSAGCASTSVDLATGCGKSSVPERIIWAPLTLGLSEALEEGYKQRCISDAAFRDWARTLPPNERRLHESLRRIEQRQQDQELEETLRNFGRPRDSPGRGQGGGG